MFNRLVASVAGRLPLYSKLVAKRHLVTTALEHMQDVAYTRLRGQGFIPQLIIDIGACEGAWSRSVRQIFPAPRMLLVEARSDEEDMLRLACQSIGNADYAICLLGAAKSDKVRFCLGKTGSSIFPERTIVPQEVTTLPMATLDELVFSHAKPREPIFMKLDVQGAELEILKGGLNTLKMAEVVQLEVALLKYNDGAPTAADVVAFMDQHDFAIYDISGFMRLNDRHLVQIDVLFVRKNSSLRPDYFTDKT